MKAVKSILLACIIGLASLAPAGAQEAQLSKIEPVTVATASTATMFTTEIADTEMLRERGLMFRQILPENHAMLFDFEKPRPVSMWMKNTYVSLDMLFVRADGTIAAIAENTVPQSLDRVSVQEPVLAVMELPAGTVKKLQIHPNDLVYHRIFKTAEE